MAQNERIERALQAALSLATKAGGDVEVPGKLAAALNYSVMPGGARVRPLIVLSVAAACGDKHPELTNAAAASLELIHCASLVHDDLPCFDDADLRRGKPSVHAAFNEPLAVLAGDSLIVLAFKMISQHAAHNPLAAINLIDVLASRTGMPLGICAGQGWESESSIDLSSYHQAKTGALFVAATQMGALSSGADPEPWSDLGAWIGEAFQIADDLHDAVSSAELRGKPGQQDIKHDRPNAVKSLGLSGALERFDSVIAAAIASIPVCPAEEALAHMVKGTSKKIVSAHLREAACQHP